MRKLLLVLAFLLIFLTACNQTSEIKITFVENGGVELEDMTIKTTDTSVEIPTPVRTGYQFDGWFTDEALTIPFTIASLLTQQGGLTLYAKWTQLINSFTITYQSNGGTDVQPQTYEVGAATTAPQPPTKTGYTFIGWYTDENLTTEHVFGQMVENNFTLYAKWQINTYTITFETNGGSPVTSLQGDYQSPISKPNDPIKTGHTFVNWYSDSNLTTPYVFGTMGSANITLYAKWTINQYTVAFDTDGGSAVATLTVDFNAVVVKPEDPTKPGYTFSGWYVDANFNAAYNFNTQVITNIQLYAKWTINTYTLTFESNGGSDISPMAQNYETTFVLPTPIKAGFDFAGWYRDTQLTIAFTDNKMPAESIVLYAKWSASPYSITFESNGGAAVSTISANYGDVITKPTDPTRLGYTFMGWYSDSALENAFVFNQMPIGGANLYAKWSINSYTLTFITNGGTTIDSMTELFNTSITAPVSTKLGYTFQGWYTEADFVNAYTFVTMGHENLTLYAKWSINNYTVTFESNGGTTITPITAPYDQVIEAPIQPEKPNHTFMGWYIDVEFTTPFVFDKMPLNGGTLYAKWMVTVYTITYIIEGEEIKQEIANGSQITHIIAPNNIGMTFRYWVEGNQEFTLTVMPTRDVTLYPLYTNNSYQIIFGNLDREPLSFKYTELIEIPNPTRVGYQFVGWYSDEFLTQSYTPDYMPYFDITVYAKFEKLAFTLYMHQDEQAIVELSLDYQQNYELPHLQRNGYQFLGWYTEAQFVSKVTTIQMGLEAIHLYAKWQVDEGFDLISDLLMNQPSDQIKVRGVITYIFSRPGFPGFYVYDGTGSIFVLASPDSYQVGDVIEFMAYFEQFENTPQLINPTLMTVSDSVYDYPVNLTMDLEAIFRLDESDPFVYGQQVTIEAYLGFDGMSFYLQAPFAMDVIVINYRSLSSDQILMPYINQTVRLDVIIHDYQSMSDLWHVAYVADSIQVVTYTPEEVISQVIALGTTQLEGRVFYPGAELMLPSVDPTYGTTLEWSINPEDAIYYNLETFTFGETETERMIELQCTIQYAGLTETVTFLVILKPDALMGFVEFEALDLDAFAKIKVLVLTHIPMMGMTIVLLDNQPILIMNNTPVNSGDEAIFVGYKHSEQGLLVLMNDPDEILVEVTRTGLPLPAPSALSVIQFSTLLGDNPQYWFKRVQLSGLIQFDPQSGYYFITDGDFGVPILSMDQTINHTLSMLEGLSVTMTGLTLPNFDEDGLLQFMFLNQPNDFDLIEVSSEQIVDFVFSQLVHQWMSPFYMPGDTVALPVTDLKFGTTISYRPIDPTGEYIDMTTGTIHPNIDTMVWLEIEVTITHEAVTHMYMLTIQVIPSVGQLTILDIQMMPIVITTLEVVVVTEPINGWMIVADETGYMALFTSRNDIHIGDRILIKGYLNGPGDNTFVGDQEDAIQSIVSHDNLLPMAPTALSHNEFLQIPSQLLMYQYRAFKLTGSLIYNESIGLYELVDETGYLVEILPKTSDSWMMLHMHQGRIVTLVGYMSNQSGHNGLLFFNQTDDLIIIETNEMILAKIQTEILRLYSEPLRPGNYVPLYTWLAPYYPTIDYQLLSSSDLYDMDYKTISSLISASTEIHFEVTITYMDITVVFDMIWMVEPIVYTSIETIKTLPGGMSVYLEAVVLFSSYDNQTPFMIVGDDTGYIVIVGNYDYDVFDLVRINGITASWAGEPALYSESFRVNWVSSNQSILTQPIPMTVDQANLISNSSPFMTYITITGTVYNVYDQLYLYDELTDSDIPFASIYEHNVLYDYSGLRITIQGFVGFNAKTAQAMLYYSGGMAGIELGYESDEEKMSALIEQGRMHFEEVIYHPFETIHMPNYYGLLDAYLTYRFISGGEYIVDQVVQWTDEPQLVILEVTALTGTYEAIFEYLITIDAYSMLTMNEVESREDDSFVVISGTVRAKTDDQAIIEDATGMIVVEGFGNFEVGDVVIIYGYVNYIYGMVQVHAYGDKALSVVMDIDESESTLSTYSLYEVAQLDPNGASLSFYTTFSGLLENRFGYFYLTNGVYEVEVHVDDDDAYQTLAGLEDQLVNLQVYYLGLEYYDQLYMSVLFTGQSSEYMVLELTNEEIAAEIMNYAIYSLESPYYTGQVLNYPTVHPYFGGSIEIINDGIHQDKITFNQGVVTVGVLSSILETELEITVTYETIVVSQSVSITLASYPIMNMVDALNYSGQIIFLKVMIVAMQFHYDTIVYITDSTGSAYFIDMSDDLHPYTGYEIIVSGYLYADGSGITYLENATIHQILGHIGITNPTPVTLSMFMVDGQLNTSLLGIPVTFSGVIIDNEYEIMMMNEGRTVVLIGNVLPGFELLKTHEGELMTVIGMLVGYQYQYDTKQLVPVIGYFSN